MKSGAIIVSAVLALASCKSNKPLVEQRTLSVKDSVSIEWRVIDTVRIARPSASVRFTVPIPVQTPDTTMREKRDHANLTINIKDGLLQADCTCDSLQVQVKQYEKEINRLRETKEETITPVITNRLTGWQRFFYRLGLLTALLVVGLSGWKLSGLIRRP